MSTRYNGDAMTMPTIVGNWQGPYSIVKRAFRLMRMLADFCLILVDVTQREDEITNVLYVLCDANPLSMGEGHSRTCMSPQIIQRWSWR